MANFPMFVSLKNKDCLIIGGGKVALRKANTLMQYGANVKIIAKEIKYQFRCEAIKKEFEPSDITNQYIVVAATDNREINKTISEICKNKNININVADSSEESSFVFGATALSYNLTIAVNSGEDNPTISKVIKNAIKDRIIRIGTRKSKLAMVQTNMIVDLIKKIDSSYICQIVEITTKGDKQLDKKLSEFGGKGAFTDEFEQALLDDRIDIAVHSGKDLPIELMKGLEIIATPKREKENDVLVTLKGTKLDPNSVVGTSSIRREKQLNYNVKNIRGNVDTRLRKLENGEYDGIVLAYAGLKRLGLDNIDKYDYHIFSTDDFYPAPCQGIIAVEGRKDSKFRFLFDKLNDEKTNIIFKTEREILSQVGLGCQMPLGLNTIYENGVISVKAVYLGDNKTYVEESGSNYVEVANSIAKKLRKVIGDM